MSNRNYLISLSYFAIFVGTPLYAGTITAQTTSQFPAGDIAQIQSITVIDNRNLLFDNVDLIVYVIPLPETQVGTNYLPLVKKDSVEEGAAIQVNKFLFLPTELNPSGLVCFDVRKRSKWSSKIGKSCVHLDPTHQTRTVDLTDDKGLFGQISYTRRHATVSTYQPPEVPTGDTLVLFRAKKLWYTESHHLLWWNFTSGMIPSHAWFGEYITPDWNGLMPSDSEKSPSLLDQTPLHHYFVVSSLPTEMAVTFWDAEPMDVTGNGDIRLFPAREEVSSVPVDASSLEQNPLDYSVGGDDVGLILSIYSVSLN